MSLNWPANDHNNVQEYQLSGIPYVSSSLTGELDGSNPFIHFHFPFVSRWIYVAQHGVGGTAPILMGFTANGTHGSSATAGVTTPNPGYNLTGSNRNYIKVFEGGTYAGPYEVKASGVFFRDGGYGGAATIHVIAGLTTVPSNPIRQMLTGSNGFQGLG
tara:strand:+ start:4026 stop:4502 length:477 start_codon:yes stop_codon:yes gene_type:complete